MLETFDVMNGQDGAAGNSGVFYGETEPEDPDVMVWIDPGGGSSTDGLIDDNLISKTSTWSSRMIVDSLAPAFDASGSVVTCNPIPGYPLSVVSQIVPVQDGDGDPGPDNVRPIFGHTEVKVSIIGKNMFDISKIEGVPGKLVNNGDGTITVTTSAGDSAVNTGKTLRELVGDIPPGDYYLNAQTTGTTKYLYLRELKSAWTFNATRSVTADDLDATISFYASGVSTTAIISEICIYPVSSDTSNLYEPYNHLSKSITAQLSQTVYGGTFDWASGLLTVDRVCLSVTGQENFVKSMADNGETVFYTLKNLSPTPMGTFEEGGTGDIYSMVSRTDPYTNYSGHIANITSLWNMKELRVRLSESIESADAFKAELARLSEAGTPFQVSYRIAEPFTVQLTPTEILALSGTNTLYTNTGDTTVVGRADQSATIKALLCRIDALEKAAIGGV